MRLPTLFTLALIGSSVLLATSASAEPTRSFPLPEPSAVGAQPGGAAPSPTTRSYVTPSQPQPAAPAATPPAAPSNYYSSHSYPQGYAAQPSTQTPGYAWQGAGQAPPQGPTADRPVQSPGDAKGDRGPTSVSLTLSLLHLIGPLAEGTLELRPFDHVGIAGVLGRGNFKVDGDDYSVWEYGGQLNIYSSAFDGLALTGEVFRFTGEGEPEPGVKGSGRGTLLSALIGYKGITSGGFTLVLQGGFTRVLAEVTAEHPQLGSASEDASTWLPMANVNLGLTL